MPTPDRDGDAHVHVSGHPAVAMPRRMPRVLLVHDDPAFALLIEEAFLWHDCRVELEVARSVGDALARLARSDGMALPTLILIGLPPHRGGDDFLTRARYTRAARAIPIVQLVQLRRAIDEDRALACGAALYLEIPENWAGYKEIVERAQQLLALAHDDIGDHSEPDVP